MNTSEKEKPLEAPPIMAVGFPVDPEILSKLGLSGATRVALEAYATKLCTFCARDIYLSPGVQRALKECPRAVPTCVLCFLRSYTGNTSKLLCVADADSVRPVAPISEEQLARVRDRLGVG